MPKRLFSNNTNKRHVYVAAQDIKYRRHDCPNRHFANYAVRVKIFCIRTGTTVSEFLMPPPPPLFRSRSDFDWQEALKVGAD